MNEQLDSDLQGVVKDLENEMQHRVEARKANLEQRMNAIEDNQPEGPEMAFKIDVDVVMKDVEFIFDLPSITIKDSRIVFGLPEVAMRDRDIIFHTPSVRMVTKKVGQYPVVEGWTVRWKDILIDVPEPFMQEQRIVVGIPEFTMKDQEIILGLPEFTMVQNRIVLSLPQITIRNVDAMVTDMQRDAQAAKDETEAGIRADLKEVGEASQGKIVAAVSKVFASARNDLMSRRDQAFVIFDGLINTLTASAADLRARNATGDTISMVESSLQKAVGDRQGAVARFEEQLNALAAQEQGVVNSMLERLAFRLPEPASAALAAQTVRTLPFALSRQPMGNLVPFASRKVVVELRAA